jgi:ribosomal protein S26
MTKKRRNNGHRIRGKTRGHVTRVRCDICSSVVAKDKVKIKSTSRSIVSKSALKDIMDMSVYKNTVGYVIPKVFNKKYYCISCANHRKIVKKN